jgi:hypothetical protein
MIINMKWMIIMDNDSYDSWMIITIIMIIITQNMFMKIYIITIMMNIMKWTYYIHQNMIQYSWNDLQLLYSCITGVGKVIQYFFRPLQRTHQMGQVPHEISCHILDNMNVIPSGNST